MRVKSLVRRGSVAGENRTNVTCPRSNVKIHAEGEEVIVATAKQSAGKPVKHEEGTRALPFNVGIAAVCPRAISPLTTQPHPSVLRDHGPREC